MSESLFDRLAGLLEERTKLNRLESRGTLRLALREAGLEPGKLTPKYASAVAERLLPRELQARGVPDAQALCASIATELRALEAGAQDAHRPESLFERLGSG